MGRLSEMCVWRLQKRKRNRWPVLKETAVLYIPHTASRAADTRGLSYRNSSIDTVTLQSPPSLSCGT